MLVMLSVWFILYVTLSQLNSNENQSNNTPAAVIVHNLW